jgi:transcriptional regulator with XRE-family HTH domain
LGVSHSTIIDWQSGSSPDDYLAVRKLAEGLGVTFSYLLTGVDDTRPKGSLPAIEEVFSDGGPLFDGYAKISIQRLIPKSEMKKKNGNRQED